MAATIEALTVEQGTANGEQLLDEMRAGVDMVSVLEAATKLAKKLRSDPELLRGLNAFVGFAQSGSLMQAPSETPDWQQITSTENTVDPRMAEQTADTLATHGTRMKRELAASSWATRFKEDWGDRLFTIWQPNQPLLAIKDMTSSAPYTLIDRGTQIMSVSSGVTLSGELQWLDLQDGGTIRLANGLFRLHERSYSDVVGTAPTIHPTPFSEHPFYSVTVQNVFERHENPHDGSDMWLSRIAVREVSDISASVHPEHVTGI